MHYYDEEIRKSRAKTENSAFVLLSMLTKNPLQLGVLKGSLHSNKKKRSVN